MTIEKITKINEGLLAFLTLIALHFLWLSVTLLGGVLFGIGPASYAMMKYYDRWLRLHERPPLIKSFFYYSKERFRQSVLISWLFLIIAAIVITNIFAPFPWFIQVANVFFLIAFLFLFMHVYTVMAATNFVTVFEILRGSALLGLGYLHYSIISWTILIVGYLVLGSYFLIGLFLMGSSLVGGVFALAGKKILQDIHPIETDQVVSKTASTTEQTVASKGEEVII